MSSRPVPQSGEDSSEAELFKYPLPADSTAASGEVAERRRQWSATVGASAGSTVAATEQRIQQIRQGAFEQGKVAAQAEFDRKLSALRDEISRALAEFVGERESYFHDVEEQVVRLSLSIVRKILHREAQIDPLLLTGILRVALERIDDNSHVKLRVNPEDLKGWRDYFARAGDTSPVPELIGDPGLGRNHIILETELGTTEIGLDTQLQEIEQGFLDLLAKRPGSRG
jgi:flagellar assembly protein FliH